MYIKLSILDTTHTDRANISISSCEYRLTKKRVFGRDYHRVRYYAMRKDLASFTKFVYMFPNYKKTKEFKTFSNLRVCMQN